MEETINHTHLVMWTVGFFFTGIGVYAILFWFIVRSLKKIVTEVKVKVDNVIDVEIVKFHSELKAIDEKKLDVILYIKDKEAATLIVNKLQTTERCELLQEVCGGKVNSALINIQRDINQLLLNQSKFFAIEEGFSLLKERVGHAIERIDAHMNGHLSAKKVT